MNRFTFSAEQAVSTIRQVEEGISIIVPVYNSESILTELVGRLRKVLSELPASHELLLVNDGSSDESWETIQKLSSEYPWIRGVNLMRNYGQHNALLCGLRMARYSVTVTMDDDLQHPPSAIPCLLKKLQEGYDVVYAASRALPHSRARTFLSRFSKLVLARAIGIRAIEQQAPFRMFRTNLRTAFADYRGADVLLDVLLTWATTRFGVVHVDYHRRFRGRSNYNLSRFLAMTVVMVTGYSTAPLRLASFVGFFFTLFGFSILSYVLVTYFLFGALAGFPFLASIISIFSGAQLFTLGIFGEYLARIFRRSLDRPPYVVAETCGKILINGHRERYAAR